MSNILSLLNQSQLSELINHSILENYLPHDIVIEENKPNHFLYIIKNGTALVLKKDIEKNTIMTLAELKSGDFFGEMSLLSNQFVGATIQASTELSVFKFDFENNKSSLAFKNNLLKIVSNSIIDRLRKSNQRLLENHTAFIESTKIKLSISIFLTQTLVALAFYIFLLPLISYIKPYLNSDSVISIFFIFVYLLVSIFIVKKSHLKPSDYGVSFNSIRKDLFQGFKACWPLFFIVILSKALWLLYNGQTLHLSNLFEPWRSLGPLSHQENFNYWGWIFFLVSYIVFSFAQEFIRSAIQGSLALFYKENKEPDLWKSILVANCVFAALHSHLSPVFAVIAFVPGLYWGWLFHKKKSFLLVSICHSLGGAFALFFVGIPY